MKKPSIAGCSILIVDDDEGIRQTLAMIMESKGFEATSVGTANEALRCLKDNFYNIVLLDIRLPDMGGLELLSKIEEIQPDADVIMITGHATFESAMNALNRGASAFITKPFEVDDLLTKINDILEKQKLILENRKLYEKIKKELRERKKVQKALKSSYELLESIMSNIHVLIAYMDKDFNFIRVNQRYAIEGGKAPEDYIGKNHFNIYPNAENELIFKKVRDTGQPFYAFEKPFVYNDQPDRGVTYWDWSVVPVKDGEDIQGLILTLVNITERVKAREKLYEAEAKYRTLVEQLPTIVYTAKPTPEIKPLYVSPQMETLLGVSPNAFITGEMGWKDLIHPDDVNRVSEYLLESMKKRSSTLLEYRVITQTKQIEWVRDEMSFICDEQGEPVLMQGVLSIITKQKKAEEELRRLQQELVNTSSREKRRIGEELHDSLGQKLTGTAMLTKIIQKKLNGHNENALAEDMGEVLDYIRSAQTQVTDMARGLYPVEIDAGGLVRALDRLVKNSKRYSNLNFEIECDEEIRVENNDIATAFYRIAQEAIDNAIKHSNAKKVYVALKCEDNTLELAVEDDGLGLNEQNITPGMGLYMMRCRAATVGARLEVGTSAYGGVSIVSTIALQ